jgi:regulator of protease activity HflC (stomatin/prohibitin superfamily)
VWHFQNQNKSYILKTANISILILEMGLKESQLLEAEGKAKAIEEIATAEAEAIRKVNIY